MLRALHLMFNEKLFFLPFLLRVYAEELWNCEFLILPTIVIIFSAFVLVLHRRAAPKDGQECFASIPTHEDEVNGSRAWGGRRVREVEKWRNSFFAELQQEKKLLIAVKQKREGEIYKDAEKSSFSSSNSLISIVCSTLFHSHATLLFLFIRLRRLSPLPPNSLRWMLNCKANIIVSSSDSGREQEKKRDETFASQSRRAFEYNFFPPYLLLIFIHSSFLRPAKFNFPPARRTIFRKISFFASMIAGATWSFFLSFFSLLAHVEWSERLAPEVAKEVKRNSSSVTQKKKQERKKNVLRGWRSAAKTLPMSEWKVLFAFFTRKSRRHANYD